MQDQSTSQWDNSVYEAAGGGRIEELQAALLARPDLIDALDPIDCRTPLFAAAANGHVSVIETLVRLGSNAIDAPTYGCTPLYTAAEKGHVSVIEALVRLGSNAIDAPAYYGHTPMYAAALNGHISTIETLFRLGSKAIDTPNNSGYSPLFAAALKGHVSAIEALVRLGSKAIDTPDNYGRTPMFLAASQENISAIELLIRLGIQGIDKLTSLRLVSEKTKKTLKALGVEHEELTTPVSEDEALEIRYRVYFGHSLTHRLLFFLDSNHA